MALSRAGTGLFWDRTQKGGDSLEGANAHPLQVVAIISLLACSPLMVGFAGPISDYMLATAVQLHDISGGINNVLNRGQ